MGDAGYLHRFWTFDDKHQNPSLLNGDETIDPGGLSGGLSLQREQPVAGADAENRCGFPRPVSVPAERICIFSATPKPLSEMAWDYFWGSPASKKLHRDPKDRDELSHVFAALVKGMEDNYAWLGQHWPDSRYVVISLNFDAQGEDKPKPYIEDWWCAYDLKTGTFSVPASFRRAQRQGLHDPSPQTAIAASESLVFGPSAMSRTGGKTLVSTDKISMLQPETASTAAGHTCPDGSEARNSGKQL